MDEKQTKQLTERPMDAGTAVVEQVRGLAMPFEELQRLGKLIAASGFYKDSKDLSQAVVKILAGAELGFGPIQSMTNVFVIEGRTQLSANLVAIKVKQAGYDYRVKKLDHTGCLLEFYDRAKPDGSRDLLGESSFFEADAKRAGKLEKDNWRKYPRNMYFARAMSNGQKWYCPDAIQGTVYTEGEIEFGNGVEPRKPPERATLTAEDLKPSADPNRGHDRANPAAQQAAPLQQGPTSAAEMAAEAPALPGHPVPEDFSHEELQELAGSAYLKAQKPPVETNEQFVAFLEDWEGTTSDLLDVVRKFRPPPARPNGGEQAKPKAQSQLGF